MSNDLDEIDAALRRAMAALDGETPPGYLDALPARTLARLDDPTIGAAIGERTDEPGGRPLRVAQDPRQSDEDDHHDDDDPVLFNSQVTTVGMLDPEGNLVVLSRADRGPAGPVAPVASIQTAPDARRFGSATAAPAPSRRGAAGPVEAPASAAASMTSAGPPGRRRSRGVRAAVIGIGLAAASAAIYLVASRRAEDTASAGSGASSMTRVVVSSNAGSGPAGDSAIGSGSAGPGVAGTGSIAPGSASGSKAGGEPLAKQPDVAGKQAVQAPDAGSSKKRKSSKAAAGRTSLSNGDRERALAAIAVQARACLAGTAAIASVRLTVAPSGRIARVAVIGLLAGTPAAACVERAVRAAAFPPWNGVAQSFDYQLPE